MKNTNSFDSLYSKHKEERQNYRLALDLKKHNWLLEKLKTTNTKPTKREINLLKRLNKKMQNISGKLTTPKMAQKRPTPALKNINSIPEKLKKITDNDTTGNGSIAGQSMPDVTDVRTTKSFSEIFHANQPYQVEPLALLNKKKLSKTERSNSLPSNSEIVNKLGIANFNNNTLVDQSEKGQSLAKKRSMSAVLNMEQNDPKRICLSVLPTKTKYWFDTKEQVSSKHNLPISVAPVMTKYRNFRQPTSEPTKNDKKSLISRESQTDLNEDMAILQFLYAQEITTVEKLKDIIESLNKIPKINEEDTNILAFLKTKGIKLQMLTQIISDAEILKKEIRNDENKLKENGGDEVEFIKEEIVPKTKVNPELIDSLVALSNENKKLINFCSTKAAVTRILTQITNSKYNGEAKNELEETKKALTNQSVIIEGSVIERNTPTINQIEISSPPHKTSCNFYGEIENVGAEEGNGHRVIPDIDNQVIASENISDKAIEDIVPQIREDVVSLIVEDKSYQIMEEGGFQIADKDTNYNVANIVEEPVAQNTGLLCKGSSVVLQEAENPVAELNIEALTVFDTIPKSTNATSNIIKRTPYLLRGTSQMEAGAQQMYPLENKRRYQLRDPRYKNRPQSFPKAENFNYFRPPSPIGFCYSNNMHRQIHPNSINNGTAGPFNQNMGFYPNNQIGPNEPYHPNNQNDNNIASYGTNNHCGRNIANDPNSQNYDNFGFGPNAQYGNSAAYSQNKHTGVIKGYGPRGPNNNVIYNSNDNNMNGGAYSQNNQVGGFGGFPQNKRPGLNSLGRYNQNSFHHGHKGSLGPNAQGVVGPNVQNSDNDLRGSMGQNIGHGSVVQILPPTTVANRVGPPSQWPATTTGNLTVISGINQPPYTPVGMSYNSSQHVTPESLWQSRRWAQM